MSWIFCLGVSVVLLTGCAQDTEVEQQLRQTALAVQGQQLGSLLRHSNTGVSVEQDSLTIQLTFGTDADLDLYVTDPLLETVYFARHSGRSGGRISKDVSCDEPQPAPSSKHQELNEVGLQSQSLYRIEEVYFETPLPGLYRIGIDYPVKCQNGGEQAAYAVSIRHGGEVTQKSGTVSFERFDVVVMEFEI